MEKHGLIFGFKQVISTTIPDPAKGWTIHDQIPIPEVWEVPFADQ